MVDVAVTPTEPTHIATWAMDDACNSGNRASAALVRQWVTYAESNCGAFGSKALRDCAGVTYCTPVQYLNAAQIYAQGSIPIQPSAQESWWLHQPGYSDPPHRLVVPWYGGGNFLNQASPQVDGWFRNFIRSRYNSYGALFMDDESPSLSGELYGSGFTSSNEITTDAGMQAAHEQLSAALAHADGTPFLQIDNALSPNPNLLSPFSMLNNPASVTGLMSEGVPEQNGTFTNYFPSLLDVMSYLDHTVNDFMVVVSHDTSGSVQSRRVHAATVLLGYSPGHTVSWSNLQTNSNDLAIWPEEGIVPARPVQTMREPGGPGCFAGTGMVCSTGGHKGLQVAAGVFRREFRACYNQGAPFGRCAAIVNTTSSPVTVRGWWLSRTYRHEITLAGGDVQSGGAVNLRGATMSAGSTTIPPQDAILLSR